MDEIINSAVHRISDGSVSAIPMEQRCVLSGVSPATPDPGWPAALGTPLEDTGFQGEEASIQASSCSSPEPDEDNSPGVWKALASRQKVQYRHLGSTRIEEPY